MELQNMGAYDVPKFGLKLKLNHIYPEKKKQDIDASFKHVVKMLPLMFRYCNYYINAKRDGRKPYMDYVKLLSGLQIYGCPLGGIGAGTIGRGYKGQFCRFQLRPGIYEYRTIHENQFIVSIRDHDDKHIFQSVLSTYEKPKQSPNGWEWNIDGSKCEYTALYPRAWTEYDLSEYGVKLICRQVSPIIPNNYKDTSLPCALFIWEVFNVCTETRTVSISFTWSQIKKPKKRQNGVFNFERYSDSQSIGITMEQNISGMPCIFTISKSKQQNDIINEGFCKFNASKSSNHVWQTLSKLGKFMPDETQNINSRKSNTMGISGAIKLNPGISENLEFCLVWDMPCVKFHNQTKLYKRFYTRYFGSEGVAGPAIASYALKNYKKWENYIFEWQNPILDNSSYPDWYKSALMNELYFISDGGTVWFDVADQYPINDPRTMYGIFGYLEGHEYRMYNTYDVHFYASFALAMLWPNLQVVLQYMFKDAIPSEINIYRSLLYTTGAVKRKVPNSVPHDLGDPDEEPFLLLNAYNVHDVSEWRDLNPKFILQVFRDFNLLRQTNNQLINNDSGRSAIGDGAAGSPVRMSVYNANTYLQDMYPVCRSLVEVMKTWDKDNDGLIENSGFPDQTFDAWVMTGPSAYCGGLWLAALFAMANMAKALGKYDEANEYERLLEQGKNSYKEKLWTGEYYRFDSNPLNKHIIMADQICGHWYLRSCGYNYEVFPKENVDNVLDVIYNNNVKGFYDGKLGASNGYVIAHDNKRGHIDHSSIASAESWTGVTYGLAALMLYEGKFKEAFDMAGSMYQTMSQNFGMNFETPEAFNEHGNYRSIGYMRPLSIWAMQHALNSAQTIPKIF